MLNSDSLAGARMAMIGDVARGEDTGRGRLEPLVDDDAVVDRESGRGGEVDARNDPGADHDRVALDRAPVRRADAFDRPRSVERLDTGAEQQLDAVVRVNVAVDGADLAAEHSLER